MAEWASRRLSNSRSNEVQKRQSHESEINVCNSVSSRLVVKITTEGIAVTVLGIIFRQIT